MKNDTIHRKKRITTCLLALLTFCLVLTGVFFIAPLEAKAAVGDTFTVDNITYEVLTETGNTFTVEVCGHTLTENTVVNIPDTVTNGNRTYTVKQIGYEAFRDCSYLTGITLPESVTVIDDRAFYNCTALTGIKIPSGVERIDLYTFYNCTALIEVELPEGLTVLDNGAFRDCISLTTVTLPGTLQRIGSQTFDGCTNLETINIPQSVEDIDTYAFQNCAKLTSIEIPLSITVIRNYTFRGCVALENVTLPEELTWIGTEAFKGCISIRSITIPSTVTSIQASAFAECTGLEKIIVLSETVTPAATNAIPSNAVVECAAGSAMEDYCQENGITYDSWGASYTVEHYQQNLNGEGYTLKDVLTLYGVDVTEATPNVYEGFTAQDFEQAAIEEDGSTLIKIYYDLVPLEVGGAFTHENIIYEVLTDEDGNRTLAVVGNTLTENTSVVIPATVQYLDKIYTVTEIAEYAFQNCELLESIDLPNTVVAINNFAFFGATNLRSIDIPESVVSIGDGAFRKSGLTSLTVPATVQSIGLNLCYECADLVTVEIYAPITEIGQLTFSKCTKLESVMLPSTLTTINWQAFWNCSSLQEINLHEGITTIDGQAFSKCSSLKEITIPSTVTTMGDSIFSQCSALETVNIYTKAAVGATMFSSCNALTEVKAYYGSGVHTQLDSGIFTPIYDVTFDVDGGEGADFDGFNGIALEVGNEVAFIDAYSPSKSGYTFAGWLGEDENTYASGDTFTLVAVEDKDVITFTAQYVDRQVESITIPAASQNQSYVVDGAFVPFDITVNYDNGETETVQVTAAMVEGFSTDSVTETAQTATVTYGEQTANFMYTVVLCMDHDYDNGFCTVCDAYQPADLTTDKYDIDGDGEFDEVYEIGNAGQLYWFADKVNNDWENFRNANAVLTANIVVNENVIVNGALNPDTSAVENFRTWIPICKEWQDDEESGYENYCGIFDGQGYGVYGVYYNTYEVVVGLFGYANDATIKNLGIVNSYFNSDYECGGIVGSAAGSYILNCYNINTLTGGCEMVGGIVGWMRSTTIEGCFSTGTVYDNTNEYFENAGFGNIVGLVNAECEIINCYQLNADPGYGVFFYNTEEVVIPQLTAEQFASGEVAYLLGESWGQTLEGENKDAYPVLGGAKVNYGYTTCDAAQSEKIYTNDEATEVKPSHTDGAAATCTEAQTCTECGAIIEEALGHKYDEQLDNTLKTGATNCQEHNIYWYDCSRCGESAKDDPSATDKWYESSEIGAHSMSSEWTNENGQHFHKCTVDGCTHTEDEGTCVGGTAATCTAAQTCTTCGTVLAEALDHDFNTPYVSMGESGHAHKCANCDEYDETVPHSSESEANCTTSKTCDFCGYVMQASGEHSFTEVIADEAHLKAAATCVSGAEYWYDCAYCDVISDTLSFIGGEPSNEHTYTDCCDTVCNLGDCGYERELTPHVHIGSSVLTNGQYLDETGNVSATKPTGGYAYLSVDTEGALTLTLHDFTYEGNTYASYAKDIYAVIFSVFDLTVKVEGENLLSVNEFEVDSYWSSIAVYGDLTVKGDGKEASSLEIGASAELMYRFDVLSAYYDLTIENVSVKAIDAEYGISSGRNILITNSKLYLATLQDCIASYGGTGDIKILNSVLECYSANGSGIYIYCTETAKALLIEGSEVYIHAWIGIDSSEELSSCTVTNSDLTVYCYNVAILCSALEATYSNISITGMNGNAEHDAMISASLVELEDCTLYIDTNNYFGLKADVASFVSCDIFVYGLYGGLGAGGLTLEGCTLVSEVGGYSTLASNDLRIVGGSLTSDLILADAYESFTVEGEAQLNGIVYVYDPDTQTTSVTVYGEVCVGKTQYLDVGYGGINWQAIAGLRVDGWLHLPEGVTGQQIAELGLTGDGKIECGSGDQAACYDTSGNNLYYQYEYEGNLDFSNVGDGEGQTSAVGDGYSFNADTLTLTLTNFAIKGDLYLPHGNVTVVLNGYVQVFGSIYLAEGEGNALISLEGDGWLGVDENVEITDESVLTSEIERSLEIGEEVSLAVDDYVMATSLSVYGMLEAQYVDIHALHGGGLCIGEGGDMVATVELTIVLSIDEEPNVADVDPWDYVVIDGGHLSGGIIPVYGDLNGAYGIFFVPEGLETNYYWHRQRAFVQSLPIESHVYDNDCDTTCNVCGAERTIAHDFTGEWQKDASGHWHVCTKNGCSVTDTKQDHESAGAATETDPEVCRICGWQIAPALGHTTHTPKAEWQKNDTHHWHECAGCVGQELNKAAHEYDNDCDTDCNVCGAPRTVAHDFTGEWQKDASGHWHVCAKNGCSVTDTKQNHVSAGAATETDPEVCSICGWQIAPALGHTTHTPKAEWQKNDTHHWHECAGCVGQELNKAAHEYDNDCDTDCNVCGAPRTVAHDFTGEWQKDASGHWYVCATNGCSVTDTKQNHESAGAATETDPEVCSVCGWQIAPALGHTTHTPEAEWQKNETHHWHECTGCDDQELNKAAHEYDNNCDTDCNVCGAPRTVAHDFTGEWQKDASGHWHVCATNGCSATDTKQNHESAGAATETDPEVCSICGWVINPALGHTTHTPETEWQKDDTYHWHECTGCDGQELDKAAHNDGNSDGSCDTCGYVMGTTPPPHTHSHGTTWVTDANEHWNECECGDKANKAAHVDDNGDNKCDTCDYTMPAHDPDTPPVDNPPADDNDGLGTGAIIGIVVAAVAVVGGGGFALFWFVIRKRRR